MSAGPAGRRASAAWLAAAVALAALTAGCSGRAAGSAPTAAPSTLAGYYAQRLDWQPCENGFECARLLVPFDYATPGGRRFSLPVIKLPAAGPSRRIGALVVNPGGPGGSGVQYALGARGEFPAAALARFDIVGFDPRGAAASEPALTCLTGPQLDKYLATDDMPANAAQLADVIAQSKLYAARCTQKSAALGWSASNPSPIARLGPDETVIATERIRWVSLPAWSRFSACPGRCSGGQSRDRRHRTSEP